MTLYDMNTHKTWHDVNFTLDKYIGKDVWILVLYVTSLRWIKILDVQDEAVSYVHIDAFGDADVDEDDTDYFTYYTVYSFKCRNYGPIDLPKYPLEDVCNRTTKMDAEDITVYMPLEVRTTDELFERWEEEW